MKNYWSYRPFLGTTSAIFGLSVMLVSYSGVLLFSCHTEAFLVVLSSLVGRCNSNLGLYLGLFCWWAMI